MQVLYLLTLSPVVEVPVVTTTTPSEPQITKPSPPLEVKDSTTVVSSFPKKNKVVCPVCGLSLFTSDQKVINSHIDDCLTEQSIESNPEMKKAKG